jgi:putative ABC transport system permease protein
VAALIFAESIAIALVGGVLGVALTFPLADVFGATVGSLLPSVAVRGETIALQVIAALLVGLVAASLPAWRAARTRIVDGLRRVA